MGFKSYVSRYRVKARQVKMENGQNVITSNGGEFAKYGDWIVHHPNGRIQIIDNEAFADAYERPAVVEVDPEPATEPGESDETEGSQTPANEPPKAVEVKSDQTPAERIAAANAAKTSV